MSLSRWRPLLLGLDGLPALFSCVTSADLGWHVGSLARDRALAMVSSSRAMWQRWASRSGFLGLGGGWFDGTGIGELARLNGLLCLALTGGRAGALRLLEDSCRFAATAAASGMLLGVLVAAGGPGGGGAGRRCGIERCRGGWGGRGGGGLDLPLSLILSVCCSLPSLMLNTLTADVSVFSRLLLDLRAREGESS